MKTKKPAAFKPRDRSKPKWAPPDREAEPPVCDTIRRNIQADSREIRNHELEISDAQRTMSELEARGREVELNYARLLEEARQVPQLPSPDFDRTGRGRYRNLIKLLRWFGRVGDTYSALSTADRLIELEKARQVKNRQVAAIERRQENVRRVRDRAQAALNRRVDDVSNHFEAFENNGCDGEAFNHFSHTPSPGLRRRLTR